MHGRSPRIDVPDPHPPQDTSSIAPRFRYVVLLVSIYLVLSANGGMFVLVVGLKQIAVDFGWPRSVPSLAYSCLFLGTGIGGIVMGYWFDRSGAGPVTGLGMTMIGVGAVLAGMVDSQWQLYAIYGIMMGLLRPSGGDRTAGGQRDALVRAPARLRGGVARGRTGPRRHPLASDLSLLQRKLGLADDISVVRCIRPAERVALDRAPLAAPAGPDGPSGARGAGPGAAVPHHRTRREASASRMRSFKRRSVSPCSRAASPCRSRSGISSPMRAISDIRTLRAAEMLAVALFTATVVRLTGGALVVDRFGGLAALLVFSGVQMAALLLYAVVEARLAIYSVSVLFGLGYGGIAMCYPVIVREHLPAAESGRRLGLVLLFGAIGMALGGGLGGYLFDLTGRYSPAFLAGAAFNVLNLGVVFALVTRRRRLGGAQPLAVAS